MWWNYGRMSQLVRRRQDSRDMYTRMWACIKWNDCHTCKIVCQIWNNYTNCTHSVIRSLRILVKHTRSSLGAVSGGLSLYVALLGASVFPHSIWRVGLAHGSHGNHLLGECQQLVCHSHLAYNESKKSEVLLQPCGHVLVHMCAILNPTSLYVVSSWVWTCLHICTHMPPYHPPWQFIKLFQPKVRLRLREYKSGSFQDK